MFYYWLFAISIPLGFFLCTKFLHKRKKYFWYEYAALMILPAVTLFMLYLSVGLEIIIIFIVWAVLGPLMEALFGYAFVKLTGKHLWLYEKFTLFNRTTSWLTVPLWGFACTGVYAADKMIASAFAK